MDRKTVLTKTAKGLMELTGKTSLLARDVRGVLSKVDGKATVGDLQARLECSERKLNDNVAKLMRGGFVREFVVAPASISPPSQMGLTGHTLDFTAFIPAADEREREAERQSAEADEVAREVAAAQRRRKLEKTRHEAEAKAKREADEKARREAQANAKAKCDADNRARHEAEVKSKREAEEKARREAEAKAKREAEEKARREAEAREKCEIEEKAHREAEVKAKREAEEKARREAEAKAKREAEEKARREAEAKAEREAGERARHDAELKAQREAEEKARREAEAKTQREAEAKAKRVAEEQLRRETKAKAKREVEERKRREAESRAKRAAEEKLRHEAEVKAKYAQEKSRLAAEKQALRAAQEATRQAQEQARAEAEAKEQAERDVARQKVREEERARTKSDAEIAARARKDEWAREETQSGANAAAPVREHEHESMAMAGRLAHRRRGGSRHWGKRFGLLLFMSLVAVVAALPFWPLNTQRYEMIAGAALDQPVSIGAASIRYLPTPHLELRDLRIGEAAKIEQADVQPGWPVLWGEVHRLRTLKLSGIELKPQAIAAALWHRTQGSIDLPANIGLERLRISGAAIAVPELNGVAHAGAHGIESIVLSDRETGSELRINPAADHAGFELHTHSAQTLLALPLPLADTVLRGEANAQGVNIREFEGRAYDGLIKGSARLSWGEQWALEGDMHVAQLDASRIAPALSGRVGGEAHFAMEASTYQRLFVQPKLVGEFNIEQGGLQGIDLVRAMQGSDRGGVTQFSALRGKFSFDKPRLALRGIRLEAGLLNANGNADMEAGEFSGRLNIEVKMPAGVQRASLNVAGTREQFRIK